MRNWYNNGSLLILSNIPKFGVLPPNLQSLRVWWLGATESLCMLGHFRFGTITQTEDSPDAVGRGSVTQSALRSGALRNSCCIQAARNLTN